MSADKVRKLLGSLLDDPENEKAWITLEERAISGELAGLGPELPQMLAEARRHLAERGEAEAVQRMLDIEEVIAPDREAKVPLLRERARVLEEELLDDKAALAATEALLALGPDPEVTESRERLLSKKARWKEIVAAFKRHAENDTTDPALIASHLASAAGILLQYKGKGRDREADQLFESALSVDPGNVRTIQLFERVLRRRGNRWDDLVAHLERSIPSVVDPRARINLLFRAARTHAARRNDIAAAERLYRAVLAIDPSNAEATRFVVAILTDRERWDDLAIFYEAQLRATPENSRDVGLLVQAGMTHWRMRNDPTSAAAHFARLRATVPDHKAAEAFFAEYTGVVPPISAPPGAHDDEVEVEAGEAEVEFDASGFEDLEGVGYEDMGDATVESPAGVIPPGFFKSDPQPSAQHHSAGAVRVVKAVVLGSDRQRHVPENAPEAARTDATTHDSPTVEAPAAMLAAFDPAPPRGPNSMLPIDDKTIIDPSALAPATIEAPPISTSIPADALATAPLIARVETPATATATARISVPTEAPSEPRASTPSPAPTAHETATTSAIATTPLVAPSPAAPAAPAAHRDRADHGAFGDGDRAPLRHRHRASHGERHAFFGACRARGAPCACEGGGPRPRPRRRGPLRRREADSPLRSRPRRRRRPRGTRTRPSTRGRWCSVRTPPTPTRAPRSCGSTRLRDAGTTSSSFSVRSSKRSAAPAPAATPRTRTASSKSCARWRTSTSTGSGRSRWWSRPSTRSSRSSRRTDPRSWRSRRATRSSGASPTW